MLTNGTLREIEAQQIEERADAKSAMPETYGRELSLRELRDLVALLAQPQAATPATGERAP